MDKCIDIKFHYTKGMVWICQNCGVEFCLLKRPKNFIKFCSKMRKIEHLKKHPVLPPKISKYQTAEQFTTAVLNIINRNGRYTTVNEISKELHVCTKEFQRLNVSIYDINNQAGFKKPVSVGTEIVKKYLDKYIEDIEREVTFEDLAPNGMVLRYDLGSEWNKLLIEIDGAMHKPGHTWYSEHRAMNDEYKNRYASSIGYKLIRVPVDDICNLTDEYLYNIFKEYIGNQQPDVKGILQNGSETDRIPRPGIAATDNP